MDEYILFFFTVNILFHFIYSIIDLTEKVGPLELPTNQTGSIEVADLSLTGEMGLWGKGLVLKDNYSPRTICASITVIDLKYKSFKTVNYLKIKKKTKKKYS